MKEDLIELIKNYSEFRNCMFFELKSKYYDNNAVFKLIDDLENEPFKLMIMFEDMVILNKGVFSKEEELYLPYTEIKSISIGAL